MIRTLIVFIAFILAGCATTRLPEPPKCHDAKDCRVQVSIIDCFGGKCAKVNIDELNLQGNNVFWDLDREAIDKGYRFKQPDGIWFKTWAGQQNFGCQPVGEGRTYRCQPLVEPTGKRYPYAVQIDGPSPVWLLDPWVVN